MAEKKTKLKKFTKEWYQYIWDYYKAHILVSIAVVLLAAFLIADMADNIKYDMNVNYIATDVIPQETSEKLSLMCAENSEDLNKNGKVDIAINQLNFTEDNMASGEMYKGMLDKLMILFNSTDELVFVVDKEMLPRFVEIKYTQDIFYKASEWFGETELSEDGYSVSLKESTALNELGLNTENLYVLVAKTDDEDGFKPEEENAISIAKFLLK